MKKKDKEILLELYKHKCREVEDLKRFFFTPREVKPFEDELKTYTKIDHEYEMDSRADEFSDFLLKVPE